jgi:APA family basic amino acid/polyamine antiporter
LDGGEVGLAALIVALRATTVTYAGWANGTYFCEEVHDPAKTVVRALFGGLALITILYIVVNVSLLHVLTPAEMAMSKLPAADALQKSYGGFADALTTGIALVSVFAIVNAQTMAYPRIVHALSRDGALPPVFGQVHANGTPRQALALVVVLSMALAASGTYESLIAAAAVVSQLVLVVLDLAVIRMRMTEPDLERPYRMPLFPLPAVLGILVNLALIAALVWEAPLDSIVGVGLLAAIALVYAVIRPNRWDTS